MPAPPNDGCAGALTISGLPFSVVISEATAIAATDSDDTAHGDGPCGSGIGHHSVWWKLTIPGGVTKVAGKVVNVDPTSVRVLTIFSGSCGAPVKLGCIKSDSGELTVTVIPGDTYWFMVSTVLQTPNPNDAVTFSLRDATPADQVTCSSATVIASVPYTNTVDTTDATAQGTTYADTPCGSGHAYHGVWYTFTVPTGVTRLAMSLTTTLGCIGIATVFSGTCVAPVNAGCIRSNQGELFFTVIPGNTYLFMVTSLIDAGCTYTFHLRDATLPAGGPTTLCITVDCGPTRQWRLFRFDVKPRGEQTG